MADITRYNPFRGLSRLDPFGRDMDDFFKGFFLTPISLDKMPDAQIPIDITEDDKGYKVRAEMPGFNKDDISVSVSGDQCRNQEGKGREERRQDHSPRVLLRQAVPLLHLAASGR